MKRVVWILSLAMIFALMVGSFASAKTEWVSFDGSQQSGVKVKLLKEDLNGIDFDVDVPGMKQISIDEKGMLYKKLEVIDGAHKVEVGKPGVPVVCQFIEIPFGVNYTIQVKASKYDVIENYNVYPAQAPAPDIAEFKDTVEFTKDETAYSTNAFYPSELAFVEDEMIVRGHRLLKVVAQPVQYNPVTKELKVYSNLRVKIKYDKPSKVKGEKRLKSEAFDSMLQPLVLNYHSNPEPLPEKGGGGGGGVVTPDPTPLPTPIQTAGGADYLIITPDDFYNEAVTLANWKAQKGLQTQVTKLSEIGTTANAIASYIMGAYVYWDPAPTYVLLLGDAPQVPVYYRTTHPYHKTYTGTDLYYAAVDGSDYYPDIYVGRLPARTATEANIMISKILDYEQHAVDNTYWYDEVLVAGYFQDDSRDGTADRWFLQTSEEVNDLLKSKQFNTITSYVKTDGSPALYYYDGTPVPSTVNFLDPTVATQTVIDAVNSGKVIVNHRDHGASRNMGNSWDGWGEPYLSTVEASNFTNSDIYPLIFTINCMTAWFDSETDFHSADYECLSEVFIRKQNAGAVGVIGATRVSYSGWNDALCKGFYDSIFPDFKSAANSRNLHFGAILNYGKMYMLTSYSSSDDITLTEFEEFCLLGDPETTLRIFEDINSGSSKSTDYPTGTEKYYELAVSSTGTYTIETSLYSSACDTELYVYDYNWNQVSYDDNSGTDSYSKITTTLNTGTYYVKVIESGNNASLKFNITVN
ncbi:MAG: pre-peptidase C-terminal domain-containing protein [Halanaerobiales bacterium]|nr:pre-peptidase C-terminal domain-containing protein [Halanaerobiales bacterium]